MTNKIRTSFASMFLPLFTIGILLLLLIVYLPSQAAPDGAFIVNTVADTDDGACDAENCTLREAIIAANRIAGADTIVFTLPPSAIITLAGSQLPIITDTLTIDGSTAVGLTISGDYLTRTFEIGSSTAVTITTLTITRGYGPYGTTGGGIFNSGTLNIFSTTLTYNSSDSSGGGIYNSGGIVNIVSSILSDNYGFVDYGGGVYNAGGIVNIFSTTISNNFGNQGGGGIYNSAGTINISDSTLRGNNTFFGNGGGIINSGGVMTISNSTVSSNYCINYHSTCYGGGVWNGGIIHVSSSTFSGNSAGGYPGPPPYGGGIFGGTLNFRNTIIANSGGGDCVSASIPININNLVEDGGCSPAFSGDPVLGPLKDNGGPTWTHALSSISLAVDNGDDAVCAAPPVNNLDQRGVTRPIDGDGDGTPRCDIGAYEYDGPPPLRSYLPIIRQD